MRQQSTNERFDYNAGKKVFRALNGKRKRTCSNIEPFNKPELWRNPNHTTKRPISRTAAKSLIMPHEAIGYIENKNKNILAIVRFLFWTFKVQCYQKTPPSQMSLWHSCTIQSTRVWVAQDFQHY